MCLHVVILGIPFWGIIGIFHVYVQRQRLSIYILKGHNTDNKEKASSIHVSSDNRSSNLSELLQ